MLKCASVCTYEIDDPEIAFEEIKANIDEKITLLAHTAGVIACHPEFIASGVQKYICENLPFELAGITTSAQAVNGEAGELILTIFIMTSDDVWFKTGVTGGLEDNIDEPVKTAVDKAVGDFNESPKLALIFTPLIFKYSGDAYIDAMEKVLPNVPVFGPVAVDDTLTYELAETIHNDDSYKTSMSFILCYGNINPRFITGTFPREKAMPYKGEITKSEGALVYEINNKNAHEYFESIGFISNGVLGGSFNFVPFLIDQRKRADYDGVPVIRGLTAFNESGAAVFRGDVDEGSTFTILASESDDVLAATRQKIQQINNLPDVNGVLMFSCIGRRMMTMRINPLQELEIARDALNIGTPFLMGYAAGEFSPTLIKNGIPTNRFHNYSLVILVI